MQGSASNSLEGARWRSQPRPPNRRRPDIPSGSTCLAAAVADPSACAEDFSRQCLDPDRGLDDFDGLRCGTSVSGTLFRSAAAADASPRKSESSLGPGVLVSL